MAIITVNGVELAAPDTITHNDEIIWAYNTGRAADGTMLGDVIAEKETFTITWGILTEEEFEAIRSNLVAGFFPITFNISSTPIEVNSYRGTLTSQPMGQLSDGKYYYRSTGVDIIQQ